VERDEEFNELSSRGGRVLWRRKRAKERSKEEREGKDDHEGIGIIKREKGSLIKEDIGRRRRSLGG